MNMPEWIIVHTAAADRKGVRAADIRRWHRERGWNDIGYHYVVCDDGAIEPGREESRVGAHAMGVNTRSIGICVTGHGDYADFNEAQYAALIPLINGLCVRYGIGADHVLGHREIGQIPGVANPHKSCPGNFVDMTKIRFALRTGAGS